MATQGDERPVSQRRVPRRARGPVRGLLAALAIGALAAPALTACEPVLPAPNVIANGSNVTEGTTVWSPNGLYRLVMQTDGNLIVRTKAGTALWTSKTSAYPHSTLVLGSDGVLRIKSPTGATVWKTPTYGVRGATVAVQDDGNVVLLGSRGEPWWATGTSTASATTRATVSSRKVSTHLATFIKMYEGLADQKAYDNALGNCTVGYGHLIHLGNCTSADLAKTYDADALFAKDLADHEQRLKSSLPNLLVTQREYDALVDYVYGHGSLTAKTSPQMYAALTTNPPSYAQVPVILRADGDTRILGLCYRRYDQADLFAGGKYDKTADSRCS